MDEEQEKELIKFLEEYHQRNQLREDRWLDECSQARNLSSCIQMAATARDQLDKKHKHQYRIRNVILQDFADKLLIQEDLISKSRTFHELYELIEQNRIRGIGLLTIYDTALRIGSYRRLYPEEVYLHRGAKRGAEKLLGMKIRGRTISKDAFPALLQFTCAEIEDILCHYVSDAKRKNYCLPLKP